MARKGGPIPRPVIINNSTESHVFSSIREIAEKFGVSQITVSRHIENGNELYGYYVDYALIPKEDSCI